MRIKDKESWWAMVQDNWDEILTILSEQLDSNSLAYDEPGDPDSALTGRNLLQELIFLKQQQDPKITRYFHAAWWIASDGYARANHPGWGQLCDLLSEEEFLYEQN
jgi:hypothetical protein